MEIKQTEQTESGDYGCLLIVLLLAVLVVLILELPAPYSLILYDFTILPMIGLPILNGIGIIRDIVLKNKSKKWEQTTGSIIQSKIVGKDILEEDFTSRYWCLEVEYEYSCNDSTYNSTKYYAGSEDEYKNKDLEETKKIRTIYEPGKSINVFYNPKSPEYGILITGISLYDYVSNFIGGLFYIIIGLFLLLAFFVFFNFDGRPHFLLFEYIGTK